MDGPKAGGVGDLDVEGETLSAASAVSSSGGEEWMVPVAPPLVPRSLCDFFFPAILTVVALCLELMRLVANWSWRRDASSQRCVYKFSYAVSRVRASPGRWQRPPDACSNAKSHENTPRSMRPVFLGTILFSVVHREAMLSGLHFHTCRGTGACWLDLSW